MALAAMSWRHGHTIFKRSLGVLAGFRVGSHDVRPRPCGRLRMRYCNSFGRRTAIGVSCSRRRLWTRKNCLFGVGLWWSVLVLLLGTHCLALRQTLVLQDACPYAARITKSESYSKLRILDRFRAPNGLDTMIVSAHGTLDWRRVEQAAAAWCSADRLVPLRSDPQREVLVVQCGTMAATERQPDVQGSRPMAAWTMVRLRPGSHCGRASNSERSVPVDLLVSWIMHHARVGIHEFIIYLNDPDACELGTIRLQERLTQQMADVPVSVTVIAWPFSPPARVHWNHIQIAAMNDCLWRYRGIYKWILFADVDEYVVPSEEALQLSPASPVLQVVENISKQLPINLCSVRMPCWWRYDVVDPVLNWSSASLVPLRGPWVGAAAPVDRVCKPHLNREKCFIQTDKVYYTAVHSVAEAYDAPCVQVWPDVHRHLRMEHRRAPRAFDDYSPTEVLYPN